jgi:glycolate oxidase FAD binding subunit
VPTDRILRPQNEKDVVDAVRATTEAGETMEIIGAGTKRGLGRPVTADVVCELYGLSGITLYEPEELVLTAKAGTTLGEIERTLARSGQHLGFEPPGLGPLYGTDTEDETIGGALACNLAGARRFMAGAARDHFLGFEAVTGHGELIKAGGRVVKNVTGYDLSKLFAGSYGTLGILTQVTVKVLPAPQRTATIIVTGLNDAEAVQLLRSAVTQPLEISGAVHLPEWAAAECEIPEIRDAGGSATMMRLEGFAVSVEDRVARLTGILSHRYAAKMLSDDSCQWFWADLNSLGPTIRRKDDHVWRISVPPSRAADVVKDIQGHIRADAWYDWGGGLIWCQVPALGGVCAEPIRAAAEAAGGHATLMRAPEEARLETPVFHPLSDAKAALVGRIKASFDPNGMFNPGRMYAEA